MRLSVAESVACAFVLSDNLKRFIFAENGCNNNNVVCGNIFHQANKKEQHFFAICNGVQ
jgi:hypothetical protein